jgi:hypothetical protein
MLKFKEKELVQGTVLIEKSSGKRYFIAKDCLDNHIVISLNDFRQISTITFKRLLNIAEKDANNLSYEIEGTLKIKAVVSKIAIVK